MVMSYLACQEGVGSPKPDPRLSFDAIKCFSRDIFVRVLHRNTTGFLRVLELVMAPNYIYKIPAIVF